MSNQLKLILLLFLAGFVAPAPAQAQFLYITNNGTITIDYYMGGANDVRIPDTVGGLPITTIGSNAFSDNFTVTSMEIGNNITNIEDGAFRDCQSLITFTVDANNASYSSAGGVLLNKAQTTLVYYPCGSVGTYAIPNTITTIGDAAFSYCALDSVTISDSVTNIGNSAFWGCGNLTNATIGTNVANIGSLSFGDCSGLTNIDIPGTVAAIGSNAFTGCSRLTSITVAAANPSYSSMDGVLFDKNQATLIEFPPGKAGTYTAPNNVEVIGDYAFYDCFNLTGVALGNKVETVGWEAFFGCAGLTNVDLGTSVTDIGVEAFAECHKLPGIIIPDSVVNIGYGVFNNCLRLATARLGANVSNIGALAFIRCTNLSSIVIPDKVLNVPDWAFEECSKLTNVTIGNGATNIGTYAFSSCPNLVSATIGSNVGNIGPSAFSGCKSLTDLKLPNSVTNLADSAFASCSSLTAVTIPPGCIIGIREFQDCSKLTNVVILDGLSAIGVGAFQNCTNLVSITIGDGVTSIGASAFQFCESLRDITIPASVTNIGYSPFHDCVNLTAITVDPNNLGYCSLNGVLFDKAQTTLISCPSKKTGAYIVPLGVISIADEAFYDCSSLTSVSIPDTVTSIGFSSFFDCYRLINVSIGNSLANIAEYAFLACDDLTSVTFAGNAPAVGYRAFDYDYGATIYYSPSATGWSNTFGDRPAIAFSLPAITVQIQSSANIFGHSATLYASGSHTNLLDFQWYKDGAAITDGVNVSGAKTAILTVQSFSPQDEGSYWVVATSFVGSVTSAPAALAGICPTLILSPATLATGSLGSYSTQFSVTNAPTPCLFTISQGSLPPGFSLTTNGYLSGIAQTFSTNNFTVTATDDNGCAVSTDYTLFIRPTGSLLDHTRPTVAITSPANKSTVTTADLFVKGIANDGASTSSSGAALVLYSLNGGPSQSATIQNKSPNWTAHIILNQGLNTLTAQAFDYRGNASAVWTSSYYLGLPADVAGAYNGLFSETNGVATNSAGMLQNFVVTSIRQGSGYLMFAGKAIFVRGQFDLNGASTILFTNLAHAYTLALQLESESKQMTGTLSDLTSGWQSALIADRAGLSPLPSGKTYTLQLSPADVTGSTAPGGWGYATLRTAADKMSISGLLGDGVSFFQLVPVSKDGNIPFYIPLYPISGVKRGLITGWLHVDAATGAITGTPAWIKPSTRAGLYPTGFSSIVNASGNSYDARLPISLNGGSLEIDNPRGGSLNFTVNISANRIFKTGGDTNALTGNITPGTGIVTLRYQPTGAGAKRMTVTGIVDQLHNSAKGAVRGSTNSVAFDLH